MNKHLRQVIHNESLLEHLEQHFPNSCNDWKVTIVFYAALHLLRYYAIQTGVVIGSSHKEMQIAMNNKGASVPNLDVDKDCTKNYSAVYSASRQARYDGIEDPILFERSCGRSLAFSKIKLQKIKNHLQAKGLPL